jgi:hypothetical protein
MTGSSKGIWVGSEMLNASARCANSLDDSDDRKGRSALDGAMPVRTQLAFVKLAMIRLMMSGIA